MSESRSDASLDQAPAGRVASGRIPLWLKLVYTAFLAVLIPVYWYYYGPTNFLYFCDVALILTLVGIWIESPLLISMCAVGIVLPQTIWVIDFVAHLFGASVIGMTDYMFKDTSVFLRGLSLFHGWIPFLLVYLVATIGYDRRAFLAWTGLGTMLILICFFFMPPPNPNAGLTPVNINYVWGPSDDAAQTWVSPVVWVAGMIVGMPLLLYAPVHLLFRRIMPQAPQSEATA
jgi:hypothetical protein